MIWEVWSNSITIGGQDWVPDVSYLWVQSHSCSRTLSCDCCRSLWEERAQLCGSDALATCSPSIFFPSRSSFEGFELLRGSFSDINCYRVWMWHFYGSVMKIKQKGKLLEMFWVDICCRVENFCLHWTLSFCRWDVIPEQNPSLFQTRACPLGVRWGGFIPFADLNRFCCMPPLWSRRYWQPAGGWDGAAQYRWVRIY